MHKESISKKFEIHFRRTLENNNLFKYLLLDIFTEGTAYIVGGFFRDFLNNKKSRDIDIIVDLSHEKLLEKLNNINIDYCINRHNGIKLICENIEVDIWSINNNWAFMNNLVKLNDDEKLLSIARGCFYNYDSLVINLHNFNYTISYYNDFLKKKELDILQLRDSYKSKNPTPEANILRAFFLKKTFNIQYSLNTKNYLINKIRNIEDEGLNPIEKLEKVKNKYPKYGAIISKSDLKHLIFDALNVENGQMYFDF